MKKVLETALLVKNASVQINRASLLQKNLILKNISKVLLENKSEILDANLSDVEQAKKNGLSDSFIDRLTLNSERIEKIVESVNSVMALPDPVGEVVYGKILPNGLKLEQVRVPLGVVGIIYEARPNVTVEAATICLKSGNGVLLRGGAEALQTNLVLVKLMKKAINISGCSAQILGFVEDISHSSACEMMELRGVLDVLIPRGGAGLIKSVVENAKVPVIETGVGNCHVFIDESADLKMALDIVKNAKFSRPWVCNAAESLLVHENIALKFLPALKLEFDNFGAKMFGCSKTLKILPDIEKAIDEDYATEYLDLKMSVKIVSSLSEAVDHILKFSSKHSETIVTSNYSSAQKFVKEIDSAVVYVNASTRFTDGFEFGMGAEIGISTQKLHARGPMGLKALTTVKFVVLGNGQVR